MAENTKERIIDAAFSFYRTPVFTDISLQQIAERVGITKAAIFKHFKNKDAVHLAMEDKMYGEVAKVLGEMKQKYESLKDDEALPLIIQFIAKKQEYFNYMVVSSVDFSEDNFYLKLKKRGVTMLDGIFCDDGSIRNLSSYFLSIFASTAMILFSALWGRVEREYREKNIALPDIVIFSEKVSSIIVNGLCGNSANITQLRMAEIDAICSSSVQEMPPLDRVLSALSKVISDVGISKVTVDRVAKELGMAKSSLYTWFTNKNEMIRTLIFSQMEQLFLLITDNMKKVETAGERLYTMLQTEASYLISRQELIDVCKWLQMNSSFEGNEKTKEKVKSDKMSVIEQFLREQEVFSNFPDIGIKGDCFHFAVAWVFMIPVFLLIHGRKHRFEQPILQAAIKDMYFMLQYGIKSFKT